MGDLKVPIEVVTDDVSQEFATILSTADPNGLLLSSGELEGLEALARYCPKLPRAFDPKARESKLRKSPPTEKDPGESLANWVEEVDCKWRLAGAPPTQIFINYGSAMAADAAGVDLVSRWRRNGNSVGIWTLDASDPNLDLVFESFLGCKDKE